MLAHHDALNSESSGTPNGALTAALDFMAASAVQPLAGDDAPATARTGQRIGEWKIVRPLGSGGMGEVFEARRADGSFEGRAAIKLLKRGMDSAAVLQRLAQERQALARLNHPHIARLFDAGATDEGPPYFVMECMEGVPIDEAAQGRPLEARIALFLQLTDAVAYAHRSLLEHRDLKPGNVLATPEAQVKLLDFGIAKALDPLDGTDADTTVGTARPFRSNYASPERVRGEPVTTATDFYSLGVLLYQLLTDVRPTGRLATTPAEAARSVLEDVPARPSSLPADLVADPHWLATRKRLEGDLDNLLMKALEKPVGRRYASVDALAAAVSGAAAAVLALTAGLGVAAWQGHEARVARDEAQRRLADIRSITRDLVFRFGDAVSYLPGGMKVEEDMLQDVLRSLDRLASSPDRDPALLADVATTYARLAELQGNDQALSLGKPEAARINTDKAIAIATDLLPRRRDDWKPAQWTARAHGTRSQVLRGQDKPREGIAELDLGAAVLARADLSNADDLGRVGVPAQRATMLIPEAQLLEQLAQRDNTAPTEALRKLDDAEAVLRPLFDQRPMLERPDLAGRPARRTQVVCRCAEADRRGRRRARPGACAHGAARPGLGRREGNAATQARRRRLRPRHLGLE